MTSHDLKAITHAFFNEVWNVKDPEAAARYLHSHVNGTESGLDEFNAFWRERVAAFPDLDFEVIDMIAEGDKVLTRWVMTGTHTGAPYLGIDAAGARVRVEGMSLDRFEKGKMIEGVDGWDALGFRQQLGIIV